MMKQHLNFGWLFKLADENQKFQEIDIPHTLVETPFSSFSEKVYQKKGIYRLTFDSSKPKDELETLKSVLRFEGVMVSCEITLNGVYLGKFNYGYLPFEVDITKHLKAKGNTLEVIVDGTEDPNMPPWGGVVDYLSFAGIYREVSILYYDEFDLVDLRIVAKHTGEISFEPILINKQNERYTIYYEIVDLATNKTLTSIAGNKGQVKNITPWSPDNPHLYKVIACIDSESSALNKQYIFGFRTIEAIGEHLYLNGAKLRLIGLNRHETYPHIGGAATKYLQYDDVKILKDLGVNFVRMSHYPQSKHFLNACDELGLLVMVETPGWQHISKKKEWRDKHLDNVERMIKRDFNHPSVIIWSTRINESPDDDELYIATQKLAKSLDQSRPTSGTRNFAKSNDLEDMYSYNDFSHNGTNKGVDKKSKITKTKKPYFISECNGHMFSTKVSDKPIHQDSHIHRHLRVLNDTLEHDNIVGISPWCMHDYYTHYQFGSGDHICYHGILDSYRLPKLASHFYRVQNASELIIEPAFSFNIGDIAEAKLTPFYVASNAAYLELYLGEHLIRRFYPDTKNFPHLPHPPFRIDYFIRENFLYRYPKIKKRTENKLGKIFNYGAINGLTNIPKRYLVYLGLCMKRFKLKYDDLVVLWNENIASWGSEASYYRFVAYNKNGEKIGERTLSASKTYDYEFNLDKDTLINDITYDTTKLMIVKVDNSKMRVPYDFTPLKVSTEGPLRVSGGALHSLHGGAITLYIHSLNKTGKGKVCVNIDNKEYTFTINVTKKGGN